MSILGGSGAKRRSYYERSEKREERERRKKEPSLQAQAEVEGTHRLCQESGWMMVGRRWPILFTTVPETRSTMGRGVDRTQAERK